MQAYVGDTRSKKLLARMRENGIGQVVVRGKLAYSRLRPWFYDNGAFVDWKAEQPFDADAYLSDMRTMATDNDKPDFYVIPDVVADGDKSIRFSCEWMTRLDGLGLSTVAPRYFAAQDGMVGVDLPWHAIDGVFIGGTKPWKVRTAKMWADTAAKAGKACHFARCGTARTVALARSLRVDSCDSSLPLWSKGNMRIFLDAMNQGIMFYDRPEESDDE